MSDEQDNTLTRRNFLTGAAALMAATGAAFSAYPFIRAMSPTKDLLAAGVQEFDISTLKLGELKTVIWRKQPVFILKRTPQMIEEAAEVKTSDLVDPAAPEERAANPELFVSLGICTHLGCIPKFVEKMPESGTSGFYCPCHGGKYDNLGRRLGGPPPENLHLVPYRLAGKDRLIIGTAEFGGYGENVRKIKDLPPVEA
ncbi:MAG: ubiquinol-cytochrome c reductase iron-sulfur subunit [Deltaproteobacteria bacterium]|nr:ubiquinol-cytochrome c reductase iron-sulfur subunit [Deltaproteobacteria bacterium]